MVLIVGLRFGKNVISAFSQSTTFLKKSTGRQDENN